MLKKPKQSIRLAKCADVVLIGGVVVCLGVLIHAKRTAFYYPPGAMHRYYVAATLAAIVCLSVMRMRPDHKVQAVLMGMSAVAAAYLVEIGLAIAGHLGALDPHVKAARALGAPFDERTQMAVARDLRAKGVDAYPYVPPSLLLPSNGLPSGGQRIFPLGGISKRIQVLGNESGKRATCLADEHGFNNPQGLFAAGHIQVAVIGDSFAHGWTVQQGEDIASHVRRKGINAINLGSGGAGPLVELAIMREYAAALRPRVVLWVYFEENDILDLLQESRAPLLVKYLDGEFSQNLLTRQSEVDEALMSHVKELERQRVKQWVRRSPAGRILKLWYLRRGLGLHRVKCPGISDALFAQFSLVLQRARDLSASWGGQMYFVYLPVWRRYAHNKDTDALFNRDRVLALVRDRDIPIVDMCEIFGAHPDVLSLFPLRIHGHYTSEGNRLIAETAMSHIEAASRPL